VITAGSCFRFVPALRLDRGAVAALNADQPTRRSCGQSTRRWPTLPPAIWGTRPA